MTGNDLPRTARLMRGLSGEAETNLDSLWNFLEAVPALRMDKILLVQKSIENGCYSVNSLDIARKMLCELG